MTALIELAEPARRVLAAIRDAGGRPMLVGGCVRDAISGTGTAPKDIDVEVYGIADLGELAGALGGEVAIGEVGRSFAVLKVGQWHGENR